MANTLTNLIPDFYAALNVVSREPVGLVTAVTISGDVARAALNQNVRVPVAAAATAADSTPAVTAPDTGDETTGNVNVTISKSRHVAVRYNGEETLGLSNAGTFANIQQQRFAEAIRTLTNEIDSDLSGLYAKASRAYGTAGTTPFATADDFGDFAGVQNILDANGAAGDRQLVMSLAAMQNFRGKQSSLFKANEAGREDFLRDGMTDRVMGLAIRQSANLSAHTAGTGSGYLLNDASSAAGDTTITVDTGTGTILAGDVTTFAGTADKYVTTTALSGSTYTIGAPGLLAGETDNDAITVGSAYTPSMAFSRSAIVLAVRAPAMPEGGDSAADMITVQDPVTGLVFELAYYKQYLQNVIHVRLAWGYEVIKPEHVALLLG